MSAKFAKGALVWVKHRTDAWQPATVSEVLPKGRIRVFFGNGKEDVVLVQADHPLLRTIPCEGDIEFAGGGGGEKEDSDDLFTDDLTKMTQLITPAVLHTLQKSYTQERFYSKLGSGTVLALNPFKDVPDLFTLKTIQSYHSVSLSELQHLPAHVYAAAQGALVTLRASVGKVNQSIIVSGESGAGKTWTVRCLMRYLAEVGIEYKRRLSSADFSASPLKGFHVTPIRSEIKEGVFEHHLPHGQVNGVLNGLDENMEFHDCSSDAPPIFTATNLGSLPGRLIPDENFNNNNNNEVEGVKMSKKTSQNGDGDAVANDFPKKLNFNDDSLSHAAGKLNESSDFEDCSEFMEEEVAELNTSVQIVDRIERRILFSNPILEAFGNARTLRNENSSRFGKYIQLQYDRSGTIVGAQLRTYLLEKTRAVRHDPGEQSYHIFYQMLHGASQKEKLDWKLPECPFPEDAQQEEKSWITNEDSTQTAPDDKATLKSDFLETRSSMVRIGISDETQVQIFKLLSAVLHLRLLTFEGTDDLQNACNLEEENVINKGSLHTAAELLGVEKEAIMKAITFREITAHSNRRKSVFHRPCTVEECYSRRDSLAKLIYEILFHWIVDRVGDSVCAPMNKWCSFIGLLDVYGFESFENNSLEQLCINYANEKLQQHFVASFLREQQEEYLAEGVAWTHCDLTDNVECLYSLEAPRNSLFSLLNEECRLNRPRAGGQLKSRVESMFKKSRYIVQPRISTKAPSFSVVHYAGQVNYRTEDLIEKNKDEVPPEITQLLTSSENNFVFNLANEGDAQGDISDVASNASDEKISPNKGKHRPTVLTRFKKSLDDLLETLASTDCHYIRCIKPNKQSVPDSFDPCFVLNQLEACGVVETIRVCAPAHPNKMSYNEFLARYCFLLRIDGPVPESLPEPDMTSSRKKRRCMTTIDLRRESCERILKALNNNNESEVHSHAIGDKTADPLQFGKTKIFMSSQLFESLESTRSEEMVKCAVVVQKAWRCFSRRMRCRAERKAIVEKRKDAAELFQRVWRSRVNIRKCRNERRKVINERRDSAARLQRSWAAYKRRSEARVQRKMLIAKRERAAIAVQSAFRGWRIRCKYKDLMDAWTQLKLIPEDEYRKMIQKRLRLLLGPEVAISPSPTYEAIKASFEMPTVAGDHDNHTPKGSTTDVMRPTPSEGACIGTPTKDAEGAHCTLETNQPTLVNVTKDAEGAHCTLETNPPTLVNVDKPATSEKLTVYYDAENSKNIVVKENVFACDLEQSLHSHGSQTAQSTPVRDPSTAETLEFELSPERPSRSLSEVRHAKIIRSMTNLDKVREADFDSLPRRARSLPHLPKGPGVIYAWHNRAVVATMTSKRPLSLSSDPLTLLELQYNENASVLTAPFSGLRSTTKRSLGRIKRSKHRHSDRHTYSRSSLNQSDFTRNSPTRFSWSPSQWNRMPRSGSGCILKYADVTPKVHVRDVAS